MIYIIWIIFFCHFCSYLLFADAICKSISKKEWFTLFGSYRDLMLETGAGRARWVCSGLRIFSCNCHYDHRHKHDHDCHFTLPVEWLNEGLVVPVATGALHLFLPRKVLLVRTILPFNYWIDENAENNNQERMHDKTFHKQRCLICPNHLITNQICPDYSYCQWLHHKISLSHLVQCTVSSMSRHEIKKHIYRRILQYLL